MAPQIKTQPKETNVVNALVPQIPGIPQGMELSRGKSKRRAPKYAELDVFNTAK